MSKIISKTDYRELLEKVSNIIEEARRKTVREINIIITQIYWEIGRLIVEEEQRGKERAKYGEYLIKHLSKDLTRQFGKGFSERNLRNMRSFYQIFPNWQTVSAEFKNPLSWSHYCELLSIKDQETRSFYHIETAQNSWSVRELKRQINSMLFERIAYSKDKRKVKELAKRGQIIEKPEDAVKDPYILEFLGIPEKSHYTETQLEQKLIAHLQDFILELGKGFTFVARQKRITIDNEHCYIDLVFYHRILRCLVLIDLKVGKIDPRDVGQMNFYLNYIKDKEILEDENPPVGIILCTESNRSKVFVEYALGGLSNKVFVSKYKLYLPTKKELEIEIKKEAERLSLMEKKK